MTIFQQIRRGNLTEAIGYALFIGMMAAGYFYNVTFIQLGLTDERVATGMAGLALGALICALLFGFWLQRTGRSADFMTKLRFVFAIVIAQTLLTLLATAVRTEAAFFTWIAFSALALGIGMPATFSLTVDLIRRRDRGMVAGLVTAGAYFASNVFSSATWTMEHFRTLSLIVMIPGTVAVGLLVLFRPPFVETLAAQHLKPEFAIGRYVTKDPATGQYRVRRSLAGLLVLLFGVFFIDSLGFLRLLDTPVYMQTAWQSEDPAVHLFIALTHVVAALAGGVLYTYLSERHLFLWIFGIFAVAHLQYSFHARIGPAGDAPLAMPMLYAIAVSLYTVVNFAIWADISTPRTIGLNTAIGVALSGWSATFLSTAIGMRWSALGMPLERHLQIVDALSMVFFLGFLILIYFSGGRRTARQEVAG